MSKKYRIGDGFLEDVYFGISQFKDDDDETHGSWGMSHHLYRKKISNICWQEES